MESPSKSASSSHIVWNTGTGIVSIISKGGNDAASLLNAKTGSPMFPDLSFTIKVINKFCMTLYPEYKMLQHFASKFLTIFHDSDRTTLKPAIYMGKYGAVISFN